MSTIATRVLIADDEELARDLMRRYVAMHDGLQLVAECRDGDAVRDAVARERPDLAFLDVQMPGPNVFDVLADLSAARVGLPIVVFATAFERYAIRAFEVNAVDYLVKPFSGERFAEAVRRTRERLRSPAPSPTALDRLVQDLGSRPERLLVPAGGRMVPLRVADIDFIRAEGDYARVHSAGCSYLVSRTLTELEARLDGRRFVRIHRSTIVNADRIREVSPVGSGRFAVVLSDATRLIISRTYAGALERWML